MRLQLLDFFKIIAKIYMEWQLSLLCINNMSVTTKLPCFERSGTQNLPC